MRILNSNAALICFGLALCSAPSLADTVRPSPAVQSGADSSAAYNHPFAPAARAELLKYRCKDKFNLVSSGAGKTVFEATCTGGKRQLIQCRGITCRPLN